MSKFDFSIDLNTDEGKRALMALTNIFCGTAEPSRPAASKPAPKKKTPPPAPKQSANSAPKQQLDTSEPTLKSMTALVREKAKNTENRKVIRAELTKYEANKLTSLNEEHYEAFHAFLTSLSNE